MTRALKTNNAMLRQDDVGQSGNKHTETRPFIYELGEAYYSPAQHWIYYGDGFEMGAGRH